MVASTFFATALLASLATAQLGPPVGKPFPQQALDGYNPLKHFGGLGPYTDRQSYGIEREAPEQCEVDQVFLLARHGERYRK